VTHKKQIIFIFSLAIVLGLIRFSFLDDPEFTLIKKERIVETISSFSVPEDMTSPMAINIEFAQNLFNEKLAVFVDARDSEDYNSGHIENAVNIPFDYYEDYEDAINNMDNRYFIYSNLIIKKPLRKRLSNLKSRWQDSNLRPPCSQSRMLLI